MDSYVIPLRIICFDQLNLPTPPPLLEFFLTGNRRNRIITDFEPNRPRDIVLGREARNGLCRVLVNSAYEIVGNADVNRAVLSARKDIDVVAHDAFRSHHRHSGACEAHTGNLEIPGPVLRTVPECRDINFNHDSKIEKSHAPRSEE